MTKGNKMTKSKTTKQMLKQMKEMEELRNLINSVDAELLDTDGALRYLAFKEWGDVCDYDHLQNK